MKIKVTMFYAKPHIRSDEIEYVVDIPDKFEHGAVINPWIWSYAAEQAILNNDEYLIIGMEVA